MWTGKGDEIARWNEKSARAAVVTARHGKGQLDRRSADIEWKPWSHNGSQSATYDLERAFVSKGGDLPGVN